MNPDEITLDEYRALARRAPKYSNTHVQSGGYAFDSKAEERRYHLLRLLERDGTIHDLRVHPVYELQPAFVTPGGRKVAAISYEGDFAYIEGDQPVVEDVKGVETDVFKIKAKLFRFRYPTIELRILPAKDARPRAGRPGKRAA
jgi:hypothetical protein